MLAKWKQRHYVTFKALSGEQNTVTPGMTANWSKTYLPTILSKYVLKDIYNGNEFGLFYQALPDKSSHYKGERCSGGKYIKVRLTGLPAGNATVERLPLFVIVRSAKPLYLSGIKILSSRYHSQKRTEWMEISLPNE